MNANIVILRENVSQDPISLAKDRETSLGRSRKADLTVMDTKLSRVHCIISFHDGMFFVRDNNSTNGTYVNGCKVTTETALKHGDTIKIGDTFVRFSVEGKPPLVSDPSCEGLSYIGPYQIVKQIGRGGIGAVYKAVHYETNETVAIKLLKPELADEERAVARFIKEAQACAQLNHPYIVKTIDFGAHMKSPYLVLEYVSSGSLSELIAVRKRLTPVEVLRIAEQVTEALAESHSHGIIHRDIKPGNILVSENMDVKLIDMGLAKMIHESGMTVSGQAIGTPRYMSSEQIVDSKSVDHRTDIYALGATLYHALCGRPPYFEINSNHITELLRQIYKSSPRPLHELINIPIIVEQLIEKMMAKSRSDRFRHAKALLKAIHKTQKKVGNS